MVLFNSVRLGRHCIRLKAMTTRLMSHKTSGSGENHQLIYALQKYLASCGPKHEELLTQLNAFLQQKQDLLALINEGGELKEMASQELEEVDESLEEVLEEAKDILLPEDRAFDGRGCRLEVLPGAGGQEASVFALEVFSLYTGYAADQGFSVNITECEKIVQFDGIHRAVAKISTYGGGHSNPGEVGAFGVFKHECGVHRVQRIPITASANKSSMLQTSTCSVAVLPLASEIDAKLNPKELKIEFTRSSGAGGQGVNTSDSACRVTHLPTGTQVKAQDERSPDTNKKLALERLSDILFQAEYEKRLSEANKSRKSQIGNMNRNEKIRTYNYSRNQLNDHRVPGSVQLANIGDFFQGRLGYDALYDLREQLESVSRTQSLKDFLDSQQS